MKKCNNNSFNIKNIGETVELYGWVQKRRNLGGLLFVDLRDRSGIIQLVVRPDSEYYDLASSLKNEAVIKVEGTIVERESKNDRLPTGEIEVIVSNLELLNQSADIPFEIADEVTSLEDTRLKYRYLDIRRNPIKNNLILRHKVALVTRNFLSEQGFIEVETPMLCKSTPEGSREYLVPSRINKGTFYALPQSPQLYKQLLMVGGIEKYFQIARCLRDEDLRADRQPEFDQIDIEMSFIDEEDIFGVVESLIKKIFKDVNDVTLDTFPRLTYNECIDRFGTDKPDLRFGMEIQDITNIFNNTNFEVFSNIIKDQGIINAIVVKNRANETSRGVIDKLTDLVKVYKAKALSFLKYNNDTFTGSLNNVLSDEEKSIIASNLSLEENDLVLIVAGSKSIVKTSLGALRAKLGHELFAFDENDYKFLWVTEFPMFEFSEEENKFVAAHHPFTAPRKEDVDKLMTDKASCYSRAYDLVCNGYELLSGSIRIHDAKVQSKVFDALEISEEEAQSKFGFLLEAFKYGAPPHGGVGIGLERLIMLLAHTENIRDVVAFPKTASASCLMTACPYTVSDKQLEELGIKITAQE